MYLRFPFQVCTWYLIFMYIAVFVVLVAQLERNVSFGTLPLNATDEGQ